MTNRKMRILAAVGDFLAQRSRSRLKSKPEFTQAEIVKRQAKAFRLLGNIDRWREV